jgi:hypothetical protein
MPFPTSPDHARRSGRVAASDHRGLLCQRSVDQDAALPGYQGFGDAIRRPAGPEADSPLCRGYKTAMLFANIKCRSFRDGAFTHHYMPRAKELRCALCGRSGSVEPYDVRLVRQQRAVRISGCGLLDGAAAGGQQAHSFDAGKHRAPELPSHAEIEPPSSECDESGTNMRQ